MIVSPNGSQMTQGQTVLDLGRERRHRRVRRASTCSTAAARRSAWCRRPSAPRCCTRWASSTSSTARPRATGSGTTSTRRTRPSGAGSARRSASSPAPTPTSCSSTPAARRWARRCSCAKRGGMIITCAATSGFMIEYDNRYLWMNLKTLKGCHFANYREAWEANRLICRGQDPPDAVGGVPARRRPARRRTRCTSNLHEGKLGVLVPRAGGGARRHRRRDARAAAPADHAVPPSRRALNGRA